MQSLNIPLGLSSKVAQVNFLVPLPSTFFTYCTYFTYFIYCTYYVHIVAFQVTDIVKADSSEGVSSLPFLINLSTRLTTIIIITIIITIMVFTIIISLIVVVTKPSKGITVIQMITLIPTIFIGVSLRMARLVTTFTSGVTPEPLLITNSLLQMTANACVLVLIQLYRNQKVKTV